MSPPQQPEITVLENVIEDNPPFDIKQLAAKGYYLEFPKKTVCKL
jgi:hypothetical protein